jgi:pimeloyl-ACP methyl ester carboxylesterase
MNGGMQPRTLVLGDGSRARVWTGGEGVPLLLVHGGWGGAATHWSTVWNQLAEHFLVIAPDLPGIAAGTEPGPRTFPEFARWLERVLDAMSVTSAWVAGNSFGGTCAWYLGARGRERCRGLVLVDGGPRESPEPIRRLFATRPMRRFFAAVARRTIYSPSALTRAFADPSLAPPELVRTLHSPTPLPYEKIVADAALAREAPIPLPRPFPILILWGAEDRLFLTHTRDARKMHRGLPGSQLKFIPSAGHFPQVERPREFVDAILAFTGMSREVPPRRPAPPPPPSLSALRDAPQDSPDSGATS